MTIREIESRKHMEYKQNRKDIYYFIVKYGIRKGNRIKYTERGDEKVEHIYEVDAIYPHCVLLRDIFDNTRICPCYGKLRMMLNEIE